MTSTHERFDDIKNEMHRSIFLGYICLPKKRYLTSYIARARPQYTRHSSPTPASSHAPYQERVTRSTKFNLNCN